MIQQNVSLQPYNTFGVAVNADYFCEITTIDELKQALKFAKENQQKIMFLGGGSNVLFTKDFDGLVILLSLKGISEEIVDENHILVSAKAGENWHEFVQYCLDKNYGGLENLSLIPGNVGTSPMQNIGAYGTEIKDIFHSCTALNIQSGTIETFNLEQCRFGYRDSLFKQEGKGKYVILEVRFLLTTKRHSIKVEYGAIRSELDKMGVATPTIQEVSKAVIAIRESKLPDPKKIGNAGSFFKNPVISKSQYEKLQNEFETIPGYPSQDEIKVPAGWLIENAGWKGKQIENVASYQLQALVLINATGRATGEEIFDFSSKIIQSIQEKYGITLEREVNII